MVLIIILNQVYEKSLCFKSTQALSRIQAQTEGHFYPFVWTTEGKL